MKLYEIPRGSKFRIKSEAVIPPDHRQIHQGEVLTFGHIDGMYSFCSDEQENVVHPAAWTEVEVV